MAATSPSRPSAAIHRAVTVDPYNRSCSSSWLRISNSSPGGCKYHLSPCHCIGCAFVDPLFTAHAIASLTPIRIRQQFGLRKATARAQRFARRCMHRSPAVSRIERDPLRPWWHRLCFIVSDSKCHSWLVFLKVELSLIDVVSLTGVNN
jgi:hypothetical protein